jgi:hypothetical protein
MLSRIADKINKKLQCISMFCLTAACLPPAEEVAPSPPSPPCDLGTTLMAIVIILLSLLLVLPAYLPSPLPPFCIMFRQLRVLRQRKKN